MGTRGLIGFKTSDKTVMIYNHFDSYPSGLGADVMNWIAARIKDAGYDGFLGQTKQQVRSMVAVSNDVPPTPEQILKCEKLGIVDLSVSKQSTSDWYCLLRGAQGDIEKTLQAGFYEDASDFAGERGFVGCEYSYALNLETEKLEFFDDGQEKMQIPLNTITEDSIDDLVRQMEGEEEEV